MTAIDFAKLLAEIRSPDHAAEFLGRRLASWLLTPEARRAAGVPEPVLPARQGTVVVLLAWDPKAAGLAHGSPFARGFGIPVEWRENAEHSTCLPSGLLDVASRVREMLDARAWGLWPAREVGEESLAGMVVDTPSCSVPLMAALYVARLGGQPTPHVFATGEWTPGGVGRVGAMQAKVEAVVNLGGTTPKPIMFVPRENEKEAGAAAADRVDVRLFPTVEPGAVAWTTALREYLGELDAPPQKAADNLARRCEYLNRPHVAASKHRQERYLELVADDLADRLRPPSGEWTRGVFVLSKSLDLVGLTLRIFRPRHALVLFSKDTKSLLDAVKRDRPEVQFEEAPIDVEPEELVERVRSWLELEPDPSKRLVELTAGGKIPTLAALAGVLQAGGSAWCLETTWVPDVPGKAKVGEERLRRIDLLFRR